MNSRSVGNCLTSTETFNPEAENPASICCSGLALGGFAKYRNYRHRAFSNERFFGRVRHALLLRPDFVPIAPPSPRFVGSSRPTVPFSYCSKQAQAR